MARARRVQEAVVTFGNNEVKFFLKNLSFRFLKYGIGKLQKLFSIKA